MKIFEVNFQTVKKIFLFTLPFSLSANDFYELPPFVFIIFSDLKTDTA